MEEQAPFTTAAKVCRRDDCEAAGQPQPLENFYRAPQTTSGYDSTCKQCRTRLQQARKAKQKNPAKPAAAKKEPLPDPVPDQTPPAECTSCCAAFLDKDIQVIYAGCSYHLDCLLEIVAPEVVRQPEKDPADYQAAEDLRETFRVETVPYLHDHPDSFGETSSHGVYLNFTDRPEMLEALEAVAENEFRSLSGQVMKILSEFLMRYVTKKGPQ